MYPRGGRDDQSPLSHGVVPGLEATVLPSRPRPVVPPWVVVPLPRPPLPPPRPLPRPDPRPRPPGLLFRGEGVVDVDDVVVVAAIDDDSERVTEAGLAGDREKLALSSSPPLLLSS